MNRNLILKKRLNIQTIPCITDICWSTYGESQYRVLTSVGGRSFADAIAACEHENTTLTSVLSADEDSFLQTFA